MARSGRETALCRCGTRESVQGAELRRHRAPAGGSEAQRGSIQQGDKREKERKGGERGGGGGRLRAWCRPPGAALAQLDQSDLEQGGGL